MIGLSVQGPTSASTPNRGSWLAKSILRFFPHLWYIWEGVSSSPRPPPPPPHRHPATTLGSHVLHFLLELNREMLFAYFISIFSMCFWEAYIFTYCPSPSHLITYGGVDLTAQLRKRISALLSLLLPNVRCPVSNCNILNFRRSTANKNLTCLVSSRCHVIKSRDSDDF